MQPYCGELLCLVAGSLQSQTKFYLLEFLVLSNSFPSSSWALLTPFQIT